MDLEVIEKRASLSDIALERIIELIVRGDLEPGERIQEAVLARQLGISRGPLREAISRLEGRNLVVRIPHIGVRIANPSDEEVLDTFRIREALEGVAAALAAARMSDAELADLSETLRSHQQQTDVAADSGYYQVAGDQDFHFAIIKGSRVDRLSAMLLGDLYHFLRVFRYRSSATPGRALAAHKEHEDILNALLRRDSEAAERAMRLHLKNARISLTAALKYDAESKTPAN